MPDVQCADCGHRQSTTIFESDPVCEECGSSDLRPVESDDE